MGNGQYHFILIVGITKINGFCSISEMFQVIIHPNSMFRSSLGLKIDKNGQFRSGVLDLNLVQNQN